MILRLESSAKDPMSLKENLDFALLSWKRAIGWGDEGYSTRGKNLRPLAAAIVREKSSH